MFRQAAQTTSIALILALGITAPSVAQNRSFCYTGECHNFHGEAHMIAALRHIDRAYRGTCRSVRITEALAARDQVFDARHEVCVHEAREHLRDATYHLQNFMSRDDWRELAAAAEQVQLALADEQALHVVARPISPVSFVYAGRCHRFPGESAVIDALEHMDHAYRATCRRDRIVESVEAKRSVLAGQRQFCSPHARRALSKAVPLLSRYAGTGELCHLERAAGLLHEALELERLARRVATAPRHVERIEPRSTARHHGFESMLQDVARSIMIGGKTRRLPY